jgi:putative PIN family toxin of toxin-antitoxin system
LKLVLDTNVVMDWLHFLDPGFGPIAQAIAESPVELVSTAECLQELRHVLARPQFGLDEVAQAEMCAAYAARVRLWTVDEPAGETSALPRCRDPDDQKFLVLAQQAGADYLLTKDRALLRLSASILKRQCGFAVLTPASFVLKVLQVSSERR